MSRSDDFINMDSDIYTMTNSMTSRYNQPKISKLSTSLRIMREDVYGPLGAISTRRNHVYKDLICHKCLDKHNKTCSDEDGLTYSNYVKYKNDIKSRKTIGGFIYKSYFHLKLDCEIIGNYKPVFPYLHELIETSVSFVALINLIEPEEIAEPVTDPVVGGDGYCWKKIFPFSNYGKFMTYAHFKQQLEFKYNGVFKMYVLLIMTEDGNLHLEDVQSFGFGKDEYLGPDLARGAETAIGKAAPPSAWVHVCKLPESHTDLPCWNDSLHNVKIETRETEPNGLINTKFVKVDHSDMTLPHELWNPNKTLVRCSIDNLIETLVTKIEENKSQNKHSTMRYGLCYYSGVLVMYRWRFVDALSNFTRHYSIDEFTVYLRTLNMQINRFKEIRGLSWLKEGIVSTDSDVTDVRLSIDRLIDSTNIYMNGWTNTTRCALVGYTPITMLEKIANDIGLDSSMVNTNQLNNAISDMVNKRVTRAVTKHTDNAIILPSSCPDDIVNDLNNEFGNGTFMRGNTAHHSHVYHHGSRVAVTNMLYNWHPREGLVYDIGGNPNVHLNAGHFNVHSVYSTNKAADNARHIKWVKNATSWAKRNCDVAKQPSVIPGMAKSVLSDQNGVWCDKGLKNCVHSNKAGSFAMSIDTIFHISLEELFDFYVRNMVIHSVHALTIPSDYSYKSSGTLKYNEGHWYKNNDNWTIEFNGESLPYTQSIDKTNVLLNTPLFTLGELVIYCKIGGHRGAHLIIEHFTLLRSELDSLYAQHVMWFNTNMDELFVMIPRIDMDKSKTLMGREPFHLEQVVINIRFYERLLNRLMQSYTWESLLSYAAGLIGRVYATSSGLHMKWDLTNAQVRDHCLVAYWSMNHINESAKPLIQQAERSNRDPDFLTSLWHSLKNWVKDFGSQFDPTGSNAIQDFIAYNKGDTLKLIQMFNNASKSVESLSVATQMVHSRSIIDWVSTDLGMIYEGVNISIDTWRLSTQMLDKLPTVYDLLTYQSSEKMYKRSLCAPQPGCTHNHDTLHSHVTSSHGKSAKCVCCGIFSNVSTNGGCNLCSGNPPCSNKNLKCQHEHTTVNDECCSKKQCTCKKTFVCLCCGLGSMSTYCNVCELTPKNNAEAYPTNSKPKQPHYQHSASMPDTMNDTSARQPEATVPSEDSREFGFKPNSSSSNNPDSDTKFEKNSGNNADMESNVSIPASKPENDKPNVATDNSRENGASPVNDNDDAFKFTKPKLAPLDELYADSSLISYPSPIINITTEERDYKHTNINLLPETYSGAIGVKVINYVNVPGDGHCGAHALARALHVNVESVKKWFSIALGHDDWNSSDELVAYAQSVNTNIITIEKDAAILTRSNEDDIAIAILHGSLIGLGMHWVPCECVIVSYASMFNVRINHTFQDMLAALPVSEVTNDEITAFTYSHSRENLSKILTIGQSLVVDYDYISVNTPGHTTNPLVSDHNTNGVKFITGPTGSGKTTLAHTLIKGKILLVTPLRSAVTTTYNYMATKYKVCCRSNSEWAPNEANNNTCHGYDIVIMTVETLYAGLFSLERGNETYTQLIKNRSIICDEIHDLTPHYARVLTQLPAHKTYLCSATIPGISTNYINTFDTTTSFMANGTFDKWFNNDIERNDINDNTCYIVSTKNETNLIRNKSVSVLNSDTLNKIDINNARKIIATKIAATSVTLPLIKTIIDSGVRIYAEMIFEPIINNKTIRFFNYTKYNYSWLEMIQSRGRVGRVQAGHFFGNCPSDSTPLAADSMLLYSMYTNTVCPSSLQSTWASITQSNYNSIKSKITSLYPTDGTTPEWDSEFITWKSVYNELLVGKKSGLRPRFSDLECSLENIMLNLSNIVGVSNVSKKIGNSVIETSIMWNEIGFDSKLLNNKKIDFNKLVVNVNESQSLINIKKDNNQQLSEKLLLMTVSTIFETITGLIASGSAIVNKNTTANQIGQFIVYPNIMAAEKSLGTKLRDNEIIGIINNSTKNITVNIVKNIPSNDTMIVVSNYRTTHYRAEIAAIEAIVESKNNIMQTLSNSTIYFGAPGTGKTTAIMKHKEGHYITTTNTQMLIKNRSWVPPNAVPYDQDLILVDEVGLMSVTTVLTLAAKCEKLICTADLQQMVNTHSDTHTMYSGYESGLQLLKSFSRNEELTLTYRFGPKTCAMVNRLGFNLKSAVDRDETITSSIGNVRNKKTISNLLFESNPDLIVCSSNALARHIRQITSINTCNFAKCQGLEVDNVLVLIDNLHNNRKDANINEFASLYVALTRHTKRVHIHVSTDDASLLKTLNVTPMLTDISVNNNIGGNWTFNFNIYGKMLDAIVDDLCKSNSFNNGISILREWGSGKISSNTALLRMDNFNINFDPSTLIFNSLHTDITTGLEVCSVSLFGHNVYLFKLFLDDNKTIIELLTSGLPSGTVVRKFMTLTGKKFIKKTGRVTAKLISAIASIMNVPREMYEFVMSFDLEEKHNIGGGINIGHLLGMALLGIKKAVILLIRITKSIKDKVMSSIDGKITAQFLKDYFYAYFNTTHSSDIGGGVWPANVVGLYQACNKAISNTAVHIYDWICDIIKKIVSFMSKNDNCTGTGEQPQTNADPEHTQGDDHDMNDKSILVNKEVITTTNKTSRKLSVTFNDKAINYYNDGNTEFTNLDGESKKLSRAQRATLQLNKHLDINSEKPEVPILTDCDTDEWTDDYELLFDYDEVVKDLETENKQKLDNTSEHVDSDYDHINDGPLLNNEDGNGIASKVKPDEPTDNNDTITSTQASELHNISQQSAKQDTSHITQLADYTYISDVKTKLNFDTFKPNFVGRMVMTVKDDTIVANISLPGAGKFGITVTKLVNKGEHKIIVKDNVSTTDLIMIKNDDGYRVYSHRENNAFSMEAFGTAIKHISKLGGGQNSSAINLISDILKTVYQFGKKLVKLSSYKMLFIAGKVSQRCLMSDNDCLTTYRKLCKRIPTSYKFSKEYEYSTSGGTTLSTIEIMSVNKSPTKLFIAIFEIFGKTRVILYSNNVGLTNILERLLLTTNAQSYNDEVGGSDGAISALLKLGINVKDILYHNNDMGVDEIKKWLYSNPLNSMFSTSNEPTHTSYKSLLYQEMHMHSEIRDKLEKNETSGKKIAFCIASGHGKTTTVNRIRRQNLEFSILDADEVQEQASILMMPFVDKMLNYKAKLEKYTAEHPTLDAMFIHSPICAPHGYKLVTIINDAAVFPVDRVWSQDNVDHLSKCGSVTHVNGYDDLYKLCVSYLNKISTGDITLENGATIVDNIDSILGYDFMHNQPGYDDLFRLPVGTQDRLEFSNGNLGLGQQRVYVTGAHVDVMRPTISKLPSALPNAITSRLMGRQKLRSMHMTIDDYELLMSKMLVNDYKTMLEIFSHDTISINYKDILDWLVNKGNKLQLLETMLKKVVNDEHATDPASISVHYKVENLMKEQVNDVLDQVGRVIVWNNQNINMYACPLINEAKARFKMMLKPDVVYADGMTIADLNESISKYRSKWLLEMDLSKQDRQTDMPILKYEWDLMRRLGVPEDFIEFMTSFMPTFKITGSNNEKAKLPAIHFSGGAMTSIGNEIRNLLLIADCVGNNYSAIYTLGDDSLVLMDTKPDLEYYDRICRSRHNVINTALCDKQCALFLQMIVNRDADGTFYLSHNFQRLKEKIAYSSYPNSSSDWKMKYAAYLMMIGYTKQTYNAMIEMGFATFPHLGTSMSQRVSANAIYNKMPEVAVFNLINDIIQTKNVISEEIIIDTTMIMTRSNLLNGYKRVGPYVDNHTTMLSTLQEYFNDHN